MSTRLIGKGFLVAGLLVLGWVTVASGVAMAGYRQSPDTLAAIAPRNAFVLSEQARGSILVDSTAAVANARRALMRDPTRASAAATLGLFYTQNGRSQRGLALLDYSQWLSRRDQQGQLWAIELAAQRGDLDGVLRQYDIAIRTSDNAADLLFPVLSRAIADPLVRARTAILLARGVPWRDSLFQYLSSRSPDLKSAGELIVATYRHHGRVSSDSRGAIISGLMETGHPDVAWQVYSAADRSASRAAVRDGGFEKIGADTGDPLEWQFKDIGSARAEIVPSRRGNALHLTAANGDGGVVAWQSLLLGPGRYRLSMSATSDEGAVAGSSTVRISCMPSGHVALEEPLAGDVSGVSFVVGAGCTTQKLQFDLSSRGEDRSIGILIDDVSLVAGATSA